MNGPDRYRTLEGRAVEGTSGESLGYLEGVDPVTGLPVLIYDFEGEPLLSPGDLESDNIPHVLWSGRVDGGSRLVVALSPGWQRLAEDSGPLSDDQLLDAARALRDAAAAGVPHGDLNPQRLLVVQGRLQVEGHGVPRTAMQGRYSPAGVTEATDAAATLEGDIYSFARVVEVLGLTDRDETVRAVLEQCTAPDPLDRPSAEELYLALEALAAQPSNDQTSATPGGETGATTGATTGAAAGTAASAATGATAGTGEHRPPRSPGTSETESPAEAESPSVPEGPSAAESPSVAESGRTSAAATGNRPNLPKPAGEGSPGPKGTGSSGEATARSAAPPPSVEGTGGERRERRIRLGLLGALMAAVVILALLALYGPRAQPSPPRPLEDTVYVVEVEVVPTDLPPVTIHVLEAPAGSSYSRSDVIGTAPRHLALDRAGTWSFQGSLDGRRSEVVEIEVPEERTVTLVIPEAGPR